MSGGVVSSNEFNQLPYLYSRARKSNASKHNSLWGMYTNVLKIFSQVRCIKSSSHAVIKKKRRSIEMIDLSFNQVHCTECRV